MAVTSSIPSRSSSPRRRYLPVRRLHALWSSYKDAKLTRVLGLVVLAALIPSQSYAVDLSQPGAIDQEQRSIYERQRSLQQQLTPKADDVRLLPTEESGIAAYPEEDTCFNIHRIVLENAETFKHVALDPLVASALGKCLGGQGISNLMSALQNRLIEAGYVTTRVLAPTQDLNSGELKLIIVPGKVSALRLSDTSTGDVYLPTTLPVREGELLDLRDIEQGLENLQRFPTASANFEIVPGEQPGESDLVVDYQQDKSWRVALYLDDSGSEATGKIQANAALFLDNPIKLSDQLYLATGKSVFEKDGQGTENWAFSYSLPIGYWMFGVSGSSNDYYQTVAGIGLDYEYSGTNEDFALQVSRVLRRTAKSKTSLSLQVSRRESHNFIEDVEIDVQRRRTAAWDLSLAHRHYIGNSTLDLDLTYRQGARWFGAIPAPEEAADNGTALPRIWRAKAQLQTPFLIGEQQFRYNGTIKGQWTDTLLTPLDRFSIGNRWSVRGFDGQLTLSADHGWYLSNDIAWRFPNQQHELYFGIDYGHVSGGGSELLLGTELAGAVIGLQGNIKGISYQLFAGKPLLKPKGFQTDDTTAGFNLSWQY